MTTLFDLTLDTAALLRNPYYGRTTTLGTDCTLIDALCPDDEGYFNGGTLWYFGSTKQEFSKIISWSLLTHTLTFNVIENLTKPDEAFAVTTNHYPLDALVRAVNQALAIIGHVYKSAVLTDVIVINQNEYNLDAGINNVKRVYVSDAAGATWTRNLHWRELDGKLTFINSQTIPGALIKVIYEYSGSQLSFCDDEIFPSTLRERIKWLAATDLARTKMNMSENNDPFIANFLKLAEQKNAELSVRLAANTISRDPILGT